MTPPPPLSRGGLYPPPMSDEGGVSPPGSPKCPLIGLSLFLVMLVFGGCSTAQNQSPAIPGRSSGDRIAPSIIDIREVAFDLEWKGVGR